MKKHSSARKDFDDFVRGYIDAALWSSNDESDEGGGAPMDRNYSRSDIATSSMKSMKRDCARFMKSNKAALAEFAASGPRPTDGSSQMSYAGYLFWLNRNGHGHGFWSFSDCDSCEKLDEASKEFGESNLYVGNVGDDGDVEVYVSPER